MSICPGWRGGEPLAGRTINESPLDLARCLPTITPTPWTAPRRQASAARRAASPTGSARIPGCSPRRSTARKPVACTARMSPTTSSSPSPGSLRCARACFRKSASARGPSFNCAAAVPAAERIGDVLHLGERAPQRIRRNSISTSFSPLLRSAARISPGLVPASRVRARSSMCKTDSGEPGSRRGLAALGEGVSWGFTESRAVQREETGDRVG